MSPYGGDLKIWEPVSVTRSQHLKYFKVDSTTGERLKDASGNVTGKLKEEYKDRYKVFDMKIMKPGTTDLTYQIPLRKREKMMMMR